MKTKRVLSIIIAFIMVVSVIGASTVSASAATEHYYGKTKSGKKIYYIVKTEKAYKIKKYASKPSKTDWKYFAKGALDVGMVFAKNTYGLSYAVLCGLLGIKNKDVSVEYGTRFFSEAQMHSIKTRKFYIYTDAKKKNKRYVYRDQYGKADLNYYVDPVGRGLKITCLKSKEDVTLKTLHYDDSTFIKNRCQVNYNHKSEEVWKLDSEVLYQTFK